MTAFNHIKAELSGQPAMVLCSPNNKTCVSADVFSHGLGAVLTQRQPGIGQFRPVAYLSCFLTAMECRCNVRYRTVCLVYPRMPCLVSYILEYRAPVW